MHTNPQSFDRIGLLEVRDIATRKLHHLNRNEQSIRECYLIKEEFFVGVRYELGPFRFTWNLNEAYASIERNDLLIESVTFFGDSNDQRRAA